MRLKSRTPKLTHFLKPRGKSKPQTTPPKRFDLLLQRLAWSSQIVLVIAGIFGYFFTVRPVHQKQLLDEQIAERTIALKTTANTLQKLQAEAQQLQSENAKLGVQADELRTEAVKTYEQFRSNLALEILSIPSRCSLDRKASSDKTEEVVNCVSDFLTKEVARHLKEDDRKVLTLVFERYKEAIAKSGPQVVKQFEDKSRRISRDIKNTQAEIKRSAEEVRTEIYNLRTARANGREVEPDPPAGRIIIRTEEDQQAYDRYSERHRNLSGQLSKLEIDRILLDSDTGSAHYEALSQLATKMLNEFRNGVKRP